MDKQFRCCNPQRKRYRLAGKRLSISKAARNRRRKLANTVAQQSSSKIDAVSPIFSAETSNSVAEFENNLFFVESENESMDVDIPVRYGGGEIAFVEESLCNLNLDTETISEEVEPNHEADKKSRPSIVRGSFHQGDSRFPGCSRGKQCTANAAAALTMCRNADPDLWTSEHVDSVLMTGDKLYMDSMTARSNVHPAEEHTDFLTATELSTDIGIDSEKYVLLVKPDWMCGHLDNDHPNDGFPNLRNRLCEFLAGEKFGILTSNYISVAVFNMAGTVWMFDSHSRSQTGKVASNGRACLMGFPDVESLFQLLRKNIPAGRTDDPSCDTYDLSEADILRQYDHEELSVHDEAKSDRPLNTIQAICDLLPEGCLEEELDSQETSTEECDMEAIIAGIVEEERLIDEHELEISHDVLNEGLQDVTGMEKGVFSFLHVWNKLHEVFDEHARGIECNFRDLRFVGYHRLGLKTSLRFKCSMCSFETSIMSEPDDDNHLDINTAAVLGSLCAGIGHSQLEQLLGAMDVKCMAASTFRRTHDTVYDGLAQTAASEMKLAGDEERNLAIQRNDVIKGIPHIPVVADGSWMKRSYKLGKYDSSSGLGAIVVFHTKKVLFVGVRNKFCSICEPAIKKREPPKDHVCYKNWGRNASSTSMEGDAILEGFKTSLDQHGLIYSVLIADGDSSVYKKITDYNPYRGHDVYVKKVECGNHLIRNVGSKVKELAKRKGIPGPLRRMITDSVTRFNYAIRKAVQYRLQQNLPSVETNKMLKRDIKNIPSHIFGAHAECASIGYFCNGVPKLNEENVVPELKRLGLFDALEDTVSRLSHHTDSLLYNVNNNTVESYNGIVAKFIGGKRINYGKRNSYNARCLGAAAQFNSKKVLTRLREVTAKAPSQVAALIETNRARWAELQKERVARAKETNVVRRAETRQQTVDKDYGPSSEQPDLSEETYVVELERHTERLKALQQNRIALERETVDQASSTQWLSTRRKLLTASKFGQVCRMRKNTSCKSTVRAILYSSTLKNVPAVDYGRKNEQNARLELERQANVQVRECGLFVDPEILGLGASPDGLIDDDGIVEIKCPYSARELTPDEAIATNNISVRGLFKNADATEMNENHAYYYQVQGQLHITGRDYCLFMMWTPKGSKIIKVDRDNEFWNNKMKSCLLQFYENCLVPEIVDSRYTRSMPIRDPLYILEAQEVASKRKQESQAKVVAKKKQKEVDDGDPH